MEKLIKLLNEYEEDKIKGTKGLEVMYLWKYEGVLYYYDNYKDENVFDNIRLLIISKEYGFIERLVRKDKIDLHSKKLELDMKRMRIPQDYYIGGLQSLILQHKKEKCLCLIALLSIQNEPIKFLLSVLK